MKRTFLFFVMVISTLSLAAQEAPKGDNYIEVSGLGEIKAVPNQASISIIIDESDPATKDVNKAEKQMISSLSKLGIDVEQDLTIDRVTSSYIKRKESGQRKSYVLKLDDISLVGKLFDTLAECGISNSRVASTSLSEESRSIIEDRVRAMAVENAKNKALQLAGPAGVGVGKPTMIQDLSYGGSPQRLMSTRANSISDAEDSISLGFEEIKLSCSVTIRFAIEY